MKATHHLEDEINHVKRRAYELELELKYAQGYLADLNYRRIVASNLEIENDKNHQN